MSHDYAYIQRLHSAARRERAQALYCLIERLTLWARSLVSGNVRAEACC